MREAVIVSTARTALAKSFRGAFNDTEAPALGGATVNAVVAKAGIDPALVEDCVFGAAAQQGTQAYNLGRLCAVAGGLPETTAGMAIERQCSSGLMSIATVAKAIMCNEYDVAIGGGVESISLTQNKHKNTYRSVSKTVTGIDPTAYIPMIETAEIVAQRYGISRQAQDEYSLLSQQRTAAAQQNNLFADEIIAMTVNKANFNKETKETSFEEVTITQ
ncbi:MAG TPA: acetyl-CoA C-acyltransferase, partial [Gammaproteobacteria bacterium]|nr:acetyl-CoA C-acyltransferase [Gammaproteobacteria bacterium]